MADQTGNPLMNEIYLWIVTAVVAAVAASTISRFWTDGGRLWRDELHDEDRLFGWRIVLFLIYPALVALDLRFTQAAAQFFGGSIASWNYGLFWYSAVPQGIGSNENLMLVLFAGALVQLLLALSLLPALFFRPHPFLSSIIGYTVVTIFGANLVAEPVLSLMGFGGSRWQLAMSLAEPSEKTYIVGACAVLASLFAYFMTRESTRLWFCDLSRPVVAEQLRDALMQEIIDPGSSYICARLAILYQRAGLHGQSKRYMKRLQSSAPRSIYSVFCGAVVNYRERKYKAAREGFLLASDLIQQDTMLKGSLLAASACSAFAQTDMQGALNLCERALEFDDASLVARMVKVDVFLRTGRKEQAGEEIMSAIRRGLDLDLDSQVPVDVDRTLLRMHRAQVAIEKRTSHSSVRSA